MAKDFEDWRSFKSSPSYDFVCDMGIVCAAPNTCTQKLSELPLPNGLAKSVLHAPKIRVTKYKLGQLNG